MPDTVTMTDYQLKNFISGLNYIDGREKDLILAALIVHSRRHSGLQKSAVEIMLSHLVEARLITESYKGRVVEKMFTE